MTDSDLPSENAGRRWRRRLLALALLLVAAWLLLAWLLNRSLDAELRDYAGPALDRKVFVPPLPSGTPNGWDAVTAAVVLLDGHEAISTEGGIRVRRPDSEVQATVDRFRQLDRAREGPDATDLERFRARLARFAIPLAVLDQAFENAYEARFDTNYAMPSPRVRIPNFLASLRLASLLRARAEVAAAEGRAAAAWHDVAALHRLACWTGTATNNLVGALVARVVARQAELTAQSLLAQARPDAASRALVLAEVRRLDPVSLFSQVFAAERIGTYQTLVDPRATRKHIGYSTNPLDGWETKTEILFGWQPWRRFNAARYLRWAQRVEQICGAVAYRQENAREQLDAAAIPEWIRPAARFTNDCLDTSQKRDLWQASNDFLELAFALEEDREANGTYPATLAPLGPNLAAKVDPFSGKPYRYLPEGGGYRLYSLGVNRHDDGGNPAYKPDGQLDPAQGDWVWQVKAAPADEPPERPAGRLW